MTVLRPIVSSPLHRHPWAARIVRCLAAGPLLGSASLAASDHFQPLGPEFTVNALLPYNQYWVRVAIADDASLLAFSFNSGQDPFARHMLTSGLPTTSNLWCTPTLNTNIQDEAETALSNDARQLIAWSERSGYDGEMMGIFGRIFQVGGTPLGAEFQINQVWQASQWRPLIAPHPAGGWVVAWSSDWDGDSIFRIVNSDGSFRSGDVRVNTFDNGAQVDTAPGVAPDGRMLMVFVDFSGHAGIGSGTNLWARLFDSNGSPLQAAEFPMNSAAYTAAEQREPRVAADGLGRFIVTWEDSVKDGASWGIFARRFDHDAVPLGQEFLVPTTTSGPQRSPRVAADRAGNFVVTWEDWSTGNADVRAQRFDAEGNRVGGEFVVNTLLAGDQRRPSVAITPATGHVVFSFEGPGVSTDAYGRVYETYRPPHSYCTAKTNSQGCAPTIHWSGTPSVGGADDFHITAVDELNNQNGLLFWGTQPNSQSFHGGTLCVMPPAARTPMQTSSGSPAGSDCSGAYDVFFSDGYMATRGIRCGDTLYAQYWSRDTGFPLPQNVSLTDALEFDVTP